MFYAPVTQAKRRRGGDVPANVTRGSALRTMQLESLAAFLPLLAGVATLSALLLTLVLSGSVALPVLVGWTMLVVAYNWIAVRRLETLGALAAGGRGTNAGIAEASLLTGLGAAIWAALPALVYAREAPEQRLVIAAAGCVMLSGALAIAATPIAAATWAAVLAGALGAALIAGSEHIAPALGVLLLFHFGLVVNVVRKVAALAGSQARAIAEQQRQNEAVSVLMREYEEQGTSWLWQTDADNIIGYVSPHIATLLGKPTHQLVGIALPAALRGHAGLGAALLARQPFAGVEADIVVNGETRSLSIAGTPVVDPDCIFRGYRGTATDATESRLSERRLRQMASIDVLTGLPNRIRMRELAENTLADAKRLSRPCALLFIDLDGFKPINDGLGQPKGDALLKAVGSALAAELGSDGVVGRLGSDEFAVVLIDAHSRVKVAETAERLIACASRPMMIDDEQLRVGASIGAAFGPIDGDSVDDLFMKAEMALGDAKTLSRGTCRFFDAKLLTAAEDRLRLEQDLRQALRLNQFALFYQPLVDAETQEVAGFEALLRWTHPVRGPVSPAVFVPIAEETGLIIDIGAWVLRTACSDAATWPDHISIAVNLSPIQLMQSNLVGTVSDVLAKTRLPANRLELEVTETVFVREADGSVEALRRLRALGVKIALDDFGTGYSSLGYLNRTLFQKLKIDGSFVRAAATRPETISIIQAIVTLANCFQMTITAEGVEQHDDFVRMRELGCHQIQGYLFGRPVPFERATALVGTRWDLPRRAVG